jgi:hypothetical protein
MKSVRGSRVPDFQTSRDKTKRRAEKSRDEGKEEQNQDY